MSAAVQLALDAPVVYSQRTVAEILHRQFHAQEWWYWFEDLRMGTGYDLASVQSLDAFAFASWPSKRLARIAYEIKVSRSDFLRELRDPHKRDAGLAVSNEFYFVAPRGVIHAKDVPAETGLILIDGGRGRRAIQAPWRKTSDPSWLFVASLVRASMKVKR